MAQKFLIVIPARFGSSRFPGKPLAKIAGKEMLLRVWEVARYVADRVGDTLCTVATDDDRIVKFCEDNAISCVMTSSRCQNGTERVAEVVRSLDDEISFAVNLQGDNPLCEPDFIEALLNEYRRDPSLEIITPCIRMSWKDLDELREHKKQTPFSGTTAIMHPITKNAIWFSKNIIPAIRKESQLREITSQSPVLKHIGLYGYRTDVLLNLSHLSESFYEKLEELEQLKFLENGINVRIVEVEYGKLGGIYGVDTEDDLARVEALIAEKGELLS